MGRSRVAALVVALCLVLPATASAGTVIGKSGGFVYRSQSTAVSAGSGVGTTLSCGTTANISGGGATLTGATARSYLGSMSSLAQGGKPNKWFAAGSVRSGGSGADFTSYAICSSQPIRVRSTSGTVGPNSSSAAQTSCSKGSLVGGGLFTAAISSSFHLERTRPLTGSTWEGRVRYQGVGSFVFAVEAYCSGRFTSRTQHTARTTVPPGQARTVATICPHSRHVSGGGGALAPPNTGSGGFVNLTRSYPIDDRSDSDKVPDDGWRTTVYNGSAQPATVTSYAVCSRRVVN